MDRVWGYARRSILPDFMTVEEQKGQIEGYAALHLDEYEFMGVTVDDLLAARTSKFLERPGAAALNVQMQRGDHLVIARMDRGWRSMDDFLACYEMWQERGIATHVIDFNLTTTSYLSSEIKQLQAVADWARLAKLERYKEARALQGCLTEPYFFRAKLGWKRVFLGWSKAGHPIRKFVPDMKMRGIMKEIVGWREQDNMTWTDIANRLTARGEVRRQRNGRRFSWSDATVKNAYKAAKKMIQEGEM